MLSVVELNEDSLDVSVVEVVDIVVELFIDVVPITVEDIWGVVEVSVTVVGGAVLVLASCVVVDVEIVIVVDASVEF